MVCVTSHIHFCDISHERSLDVAQVPGMSVGTISHT
jgi:hypothetical protein